LKPKQLFVAAIGEEDEKFTEIWLVIMMEYLLLNIGIRTSLLLIL